MSKQYWKGFLVPFMVVAATGAEGQEEGFRGWVGLYNPERLGWLENENRVLSLCANVEDFGSCYEEMLAAAIDVYPLYADRDPASPTVGDLIVAAVPGRGLTAYYRPIEAGQGIGFQPDLFDNDWGYGPYFHQTIVREEGEWFQLPPDPWDRTVWVRREGPEPGQSVIEVRAGDFIEMGGQGMFVVATTTESNLASTGAGRRLLV